MLGRHNVLPDMRERTWLMDTATHERMTVEHIQLTGRLTNLERFIASNQFAALCESDRADLVEQFTYMLGYQIVLAHRLRRHDKIHEVSRDAE